MLSVKLYGDVVLVECRLPLTYNSTLLTATLSVAVAVTVAVPVSVALLAGVVMVVTGDVVSGAGVPAMNCGLTKYSVSM